MRKEVKVGFIISGIAITIMLVVFSIVAVSQTKDVYRMEMSGEEHVTLEFGSDYEDAGFVLYKNDKILEVDEKKGITEEDISSGVKVDNQVDFEKLGEYKIIYTLVYDDLQIFERTVKIVDTVNPEIKIDHSEESIFEGEDYEEAVVTASDNYDGDLTDAIVVEGKVDPGKAGVYEVLYNVEDSSGNTAQAALKVTIKEVIVEPEPTPTPSASGGNSNAGSSAGGGSSNTGTGGGSTGVPSKHSGPAGAKGGFTMSGQGGAGSTGTSKSPFTAEKNNTTAKNEITRLKFIGNGIYIEGVHDTSINNVAIMDASGNLVKTVEQARRGSAYSSILDLTDVANGTYTIVSPELGNAKLANLFDTDRRIVQAKVGNKLVKVTYPSNTVQFSVSDFAYQYDIAINAGHGGHDGGAQGNGQSEKALNVMVSLYEKKRFEDHGLKVYINRTSDATYGEMSGPENWHVLRRSAHKLGEIATVSRFAYSNHHNSTGGNVNKSGWEILVNARATKADLALEHRLGAAWTGIYGKAMTGTTIYTRNYYTDGTLSKMNGQVYDITDYYGMQRQTDMIYNEYVPTYEHIYISNAKDTAWYMSGAWKTMAEAKIKEYVTAVGKTYVAP